MLKCINSIRLACHFKLQNIAPKAEIDAVKTQSEAKGNSWPISAYVKKSIFANKQCLRLEEIFFLLISSLSFFFFNFM